MHQIQKYLTTIIQYYKIIVVLLIEIKYISNVFD